MSLEVFSSILSHVDLEYCKTRPAAARKLFVLPDYVISSTGYELVSFLHIDNDVYRNKVSMWILVSKLYLY